MSLECVHVEGPNGEKWHKINGKVCHSLEKARPALDAASESLWNVAQLMNNNNGSEDLTCAHCSVVGCTVDSPEGREIERMVESMRDQGISNWKIWFACYKGFTHEIHGVLGKGKQMELPQCVTDSVKDDYPVVDDNGKCTGFKERTTATCRAAA